jgi:hypothetical protein
MAVKFFSSSSIAEARPGLPQPVIIYSTSGSSDNVMSVTATSFSAVSVTAIGTVEAVITLPYACNVIITYSAWLTAGPNSTAESLRVGTAASGANTWAAGGATGWGNVIATTGLAANGGFQQHATSYAIALAAGTTTVQMQAYRSAVALTTASISFPFLSVTPISWV